MDTSRTQFKTVDEYIDSFPDDVRTILQHLRQAINEEAPDAEEAMSYQMPTFKLRGKNLVHFAAFKNHIGFYPTPSGVAAFTNELSTYRTAKGSVQFPITQPLPLSLVRKIVAFRVKENVEKNKQ